MPVRKASARHPLNKIEGRTAQQKTQARGTTEEKTKVTEDAKKTWNAKCANMIRSSAQVILPEAERQERKKRRKRQRQKKEMARGEEVMRRRDETEQKGCS